MDRLAGLSKELPKALDAFDEPGTARAAAEGSGGPSFGSFLSDVIGDANRLRQDADSTVVKLVTGEINDIHSVMVAMNRADLSFRMVVEVRNKLVEAYQEVMRMQV